MINIFSNGAFIIGLEQVKKLSLIDLTAFPPFLRFNRVQLTYTNGFESIEEKCEFNGSYLLALKSALNNSALIEAKFGISEFDYDFISHSHLLEYVQNRLLPICESSRGYKFQIHLESDKNSTKGLIASLLQMPKIKRCSNIEIKIIEAGQKELPVNEISSWLERSTADGMENGVQNKKERFLTIGFYGFLLWFMPAIYIQNSREMVDHLKEVHFKNNP